MGEEGREDYSFMRAGMGAPNMSVSNEALTQTTNTMMMMGIAMITKSAETAATYAKHAGRSSVQVKDVHVATKYQAKYFMEKVSDEEIYETVEDMKKALADDTENGEENDDDDAPSLEEDPEDIEDDGEPWTPSTCKCELCQTINETDRTWSSYNPEDDVLAFLKRTVDNSIAATTHVQRTDDF